MGNISAFIKKTIANKNTVTILLVLAGVVVLWFFYNMRVKEATTPIKVPYAKEELHATDEITEDKIGMVEVNSKLLKTADIIQNQGSLIGYYVTTGPSIPKGGLFSKAQVVTKAELPNSVFDDIPDKHTIYSMSVNNHTTFGNSIYPGDKIDLYLKATDDSGKIMFGKFIESISVLGVRDSSGKDVFGSTETRTPAELLFAVPNDMYELLMKAGYVSGITLVPVPRNKHYTDLNADTVTIDYLKNFILAKTATLPTE